jgi:hypothetical protein
MGVSARNLTINQGLTSFESALQLAYEDLRVGAIHTALVGGVDENCFPRSDYVRRWPLHDDEIMGEGSAWIALSNDSHDALAELSLVRVTRRGVEDLAAAIGRSDDIDGIVLGAQLSEDDVQALKRAFPRAQFVRYAEYCGHYPTASSYGVAHQLQNTAELGSWLHVNRNGESTAFVGWRALKAVSRSPSPVGRGSG